MWGVFLLTHNNINFTLKKMNKEHCNKINYDPAKIVIYTHSKVDSFIGIPIEKSNKIRKSYKFIKKILNRKVKKKLKEIYFSITKKMNIMRVIQKTTEVLK